MGDVDGDGAEDLAVGSPFNDVAGTNAGMARVYSGKTQQAIFTWYGSGPNDRFGGSIARAGDVDGDGRSDVIVGAPLGQYVEVFSGATGSVIHHLTGVIGAFGRSVAGGGHIDADGVPDILVGAPDATSGANYAGVVAAFSGASGALIRSHAGPSCGLFLGESVAFCGDVDGDGLDEYAAGGPSSCASCSHPRILCFDGAGGALRWTRESTLDWSQQTGWSLAPLDDVNGDGIPELIAGAPQDPGFNCTAQGKGSVEVLDGATGVQLWQANGLFDHAGLGYAVTSAGDVNDDGFADVAASQPATDGSGGLTRRIQIRSGPTGALLLQIAVLTPSGDRFGYAMAMGDANADGLLDLVVGAPEYDGLGPDAGGIHAYTIVRLTTNYCWAKTNSQGCTPQMFADGVPSAASSDFTARAQQVLNNQNGILFWSRTPQATPFQGGHLCVKPPLVRTPIQSSGGNPPPADCSGAYSFQFTSAYMASHGIVPGEQIYCQYWTRDPQSPSTTGLTDALAFYVLP